jgi:hypothetical protein
LLAVTSINISCAFMPVALVYKARIMFEALLADQ